MTTRIGSCPTKNVELKVFGEHSLCRKLLPFLHHNVYFTSRRAG